MLKVTQPVNSNQDSNTGVRESAVELVKAKTLSSEKCRGSWFCVVSGFHLEESYYRSPTLYRRAQKSQVSSGARQGMWMGAGAGWEKGQWALDGSWTPPKSICTGPSRCPVLDQEYLPVGWTQGHCNQCAASARIPHGPLFAYLPTGMCDAPNICKNCPPSSGRSAANSNLNFQLQGPELLPLIPTTTTPPGIQGPNHAPPLGFWWSRDVFRVWVTRLGESDCVTPADRHRGGGGQLALKDTEFRQWHFPGPTWLQDNGRGSTVAEQCLVSVFLVPSAQSSFCSPNLSSVFVLPHTHPQEVRNSCLAPGKLPFLNIAIFFLGGTCCIFF